MKENRDNRYHGRISSATKARWQQAANEQGYRTLALFIEEAVEEKIQGAAPDAGRSPGWSPALGGEPSREATPSVEQAGVSEQVDEAASSPAVERRAGSSPATGTCPNEAKHRKGIYCKACRKVVR